MPEYPTLKRGGNSPAFGPAGEFYDGDMGKVALRSENAAISNLDDRQTFGAPNVR